MMRIHGSSHRRCSVKKVFLEILKTFTGKNLCQSLFFNKVAGLRQQSSEFSEIPKKTSSYRTRTPPVAASGFIN